MLKAIGGAIGVLMLTACPNNNAQTLTMGSMGTMSFAYDSVTHGGGDLQAAKTTDTAFVLVGTSTSGSASSTSSTGSTTAAITCNATVSYDNSKSPKAVALILSCPSQ